MNKTELITQVSQRSGLARKDAERAVNAAVDAICQCLSQGEKVQLTGFGIFEVKDREARVGRNPRTLETVEIPASRQPVFKPSKMLKEQVAKHEA